MGQILLSFYSMYRTVAVPGTVSTGTDTEKHSYINNWTGKEILSTQIHVRCNEKNFLQVGLSKVTVLFNTNKNDLQT